MSAFAANRTDQETKKAWEKNWENISVEEVLSIFRYVRVKKQMEIYTRVLPKPGRILEGGCGLAPYLIQLRRLGFDVVGIDYNENPIAKVKAFDPSLPVFVGDVTRIDFPDRCFDGYLSLGVIEHFSEGPEKAIREACRVLKKGGVFVVAVPRNHLFMRLAAPARWLKANARLRRFLGKSQENHYWEQYFKRKKLIRTLEEGGFEVRETHALDHSHALVSFSSFFRDRRTYDEASPLGLRLGSWLEKHLRWSTAAQMTLVCYKK